ncbi:MAG: hypothetical protein HRU50_13445 [Winogradskyella sp.]|uniref:hypothetical protein n=1 Tax=Winogradskyella sp. TaxID=1883156 RepID=UPI0025F44EF8|nr:hypothetical protein [Winogradskyella sp.]NRB60928.1 hypothetical protein [Winogradskyella sp.]
MEHYRQNYSKVQVDSVDKARQSAKHVDKKRLNPKIVISIVILALTGLITLSYMNGNIFIEKIAICSFIISCLLLIKLSNDSVVKK